MSRKIAATTPSAPQTSVAKVLQVHAVHNSQLHIKSSHKGISKDEVAANDRVLLKAGS
jgi:hypothetical protein